MKKTILIGIAWVIAIVSVTAMTGCGSDDNDPTTPVAVTGVTLDQTTLSLVIGGNITLTATVLPENATNKTVTWTSSNPAVATVDAAGKVTALTVGEATITAKAGDKTATCVVTVNPVVVSSVTLNVPTVSVFVGEDKILTATVLPDNATNRNVVWTSSNPAVATVDAAGKLTALTAGETTITAKAGEKTATCVVTSTYPANIAILSGAGAERIYLVGTGDNATLQLTMEQNYTSALFQFGGVIGYDQSSDLTPIYNPTTSLINSWNSSWTSDAVHSVENLKAGKGDPCRLVGYKASQVRSMLATNILPDNGVWRTPTNEENEAFSTGYSRTGWNTVGAFNGHYFPTSTSTTNWLPASGTRTRANGAFASAGSSGYGWSSSVCYALAFSATDVNPAGNANRATGYPVRCVQQ